MKTHNNGIYKGIQENWEKIKRIYSKIYLDNATETDAISLDSLETLLGEVGFVEKWGFLNKERTDYLKHVTEGINAMIENLYGLDLKEDKLLAPVHFRYGLPKGLEESTLN